MKYEITGTIEKEVTEVIEGTLADVVREFTEKHNTVPEVINGICVEHICEACSEPIFEGQNYGYGGEGVYLHKRCAPLQPRMNTSTA